MGIGKPVGPVTAAIRAIQQSVDDPHEPEFINPAGDVIGLFGIAVLRFSKPTARRRSAVSVGCIEVGQRGCRAINYGAGTGGDLGNFRTAAEAEAAILARTPLKPHPANWRKLDFATTH
ncbi:hypothetical protein PKCBPO_02514 [Methylorubrum thiocyanatum]